MLRESRFALDLELLVLARRLGYTRIVEAPVRIEERFGSTISLKAVWLLLVDTLGLFVRYSVRHDYDAALADAGGGGRGPAVRRVPPILAPADAGGRLAAGRGCGARWRLSSPGRAVVHSSSTSRCGEGF